jgi:hypothetical protein
MSHDINLDPEFGELERLHGSKGIRVWLQVLAMLDKTNNAWNLHTQFDLRNLAAICQTKPKIIMQVYWFLLEKKWIRSGLNSENIQVISAPNYMNYHRSRDPKSATIGTELVGKVLPPQGGKKQEQAPTSSKKDKTLKKESTKKSTWPIGFEPTSERLCYASDHGISDPGDEFENFRLYCVKNNKQYVNWDAAWQSWCRSPYQAKTQTPEGGLG